VQFDADGGVCGFDLEAEAFIEIGELPSRQSLVADRGQAPITQVVQIAPGRLKICSWGIEFAPGYLRGLPEIGDVEGPRSLVWRVSRSESVQSDRTSPSLV
jgi:hypothetical protein